MNEKPSYESYEEVAKDLLNKFADEFGISFVEGKQLIKGHRRSGTYWKIDAKGVKEGGEGFFIVECRRYTTSKQKQEDLASLAYKILDTGAQGGIVVSPFGIQKGAAKIAKSENILDVHLDANSTPKDFAMQFLNKLMFGVSAKAVFGNSSTAEVIRACQSCGKKFNVRKNERLCPNCIQE